MKLVYRVSNTKVNWPLDLDNKIIKELKDYK